MERIMKAKNVSELQGIGEEWLFDKDGQEVIAVFYDGNFKRALKALSKEQRETETVTVAA